MDELGYYEWIESLDPKKKETYQFVMMMIHDWSNERRDELLQQFNIRREYTAGKYRNRQEFVYNELDKAREELMKVNLPCDWYKLFDKVFKIQEEIEIAKKENQFNFIIDHDEEYEVLLHDLFKDAHLVDHYLNANINIEDPGTYWTLIEKIKHSKEVVELLGRYSWLLFLMNFIESEDYNVKSRVPYLPDCFINEKDFQKYLNQPQISDLYIVRDGKYFLNAGKKVYLAGFAHTLLNRGKLIESVKTSQDLAKIFCSFFHVPYNPKEEKQFQPDRAKTDIFCFIK